MRVNPYNPDVELMKYGIREIVDVAQKLEELIPDFEIIYENIGDPIAKGWPAPPFLKEAITFISFVYLFFMKRLCK